MKGAFLFFLALLLACEAGAWFIIDPDTAISRAVSVVVGFVVFIITFFIIVLAVAAD